MPGQVTHFYLAARLARQFGPFKGKDIRGEIYDGFDRWLKLNKQFKTAVAAIIAAEAADSTHSENANKMQKILTPTERISWIQTILPFSAPLQQER